MNKGNQQVITNSSSYELSHTPLHSHILLSISISESLYTEYQQDPLLDQHLHLHYEKWKEDIDIQSVTSVMLPLISYNQLLLNNRLFLSLFLSMIWEHSSFDSNSDSCKCFHSHNLQHNHLSILQQSNWV